MLCPGGWLGRIIVPTGLEARQSPDILPATLGSRLDGGGVRAHAFGGSDRFAAVHRRASLTKLASTRTGEGVRRCERGRAHGPQIGRARSLVLAAKVETVVYYPSKKDSIDEYSPSIEDNHA